MPAWSRRLQEMRARPFSREHHAFFDLALLLVLVLAFAGFAVFLPDWHPHVLHISAPFKKGIALFRLSNRFCQWQCASYYRRILTSERKKSIRIREPVNESPHHQSPSFSTFRVLDSGCASDQCWPARRVLEKAARQIEPQRGTRNDLLFQLGRPGQCE